MLNSIGERLAPWGTQHSRGVLGNNHPRSATLCPWPWRNEVSHCKAVPCTPMLARWWTSNFWSTVSNTAIRSSKISSADLPRSSCLQRPYMEYLAKHGLKTKPPQLLTYNPDQQWVWPFVEFRSCIILSLSQCCHPHPHDVFYISHYLFIPGCCFFFHDRSPKYFANTIDSTEGMEGTVGLALTLKGSENAGHGLPEWEMTLWQAKPRVIDSQFHQQSGQDTWFYKQGMPFSLQDQIFNASPVESILLSLNSISSWMETAPGKPLQCSSNGPVRIVPAAHFLAGTPEGSLWPSTCLFFWKFNSLAHLMYSIWDSSGRGIDTRIIDL